MYQITLFIHVLVAAFIILLVLIQQGKGATMGAAFGSGASQTVFGARGTSSVLYNITMICIMIFFSTSIIMDYYATSAFKEAGKLAPVNRTLPVRQSTTAPLTAPASVPAPVLPLSAAPAATDPVAPAQQRAAASAASKTSATKTAPVSSQTKSLTDQIPVKK